MSARACAFSDRMLKALCTKLRYAMVTQFQEIVHAKLRKEAHFLENRSKSEKVTEHGKLMLRPLSFWK